MSMVLSTLMSLSGAAMGAGRDNGPTMPGVPLSEAIEMLRSELDTALTSGDGQRVRFDLPEVTLTLSVVATNETKGEAGVRWWVVNAGGSTASGYQQTQTLTLTLRPKHVSADGQAADLQVRATDTASGARFRGMSS
jgi:hypothetical protein